VTREMSTGQSVVMLCGWEWRQDGSFHSWINVWVAGKTACVISLTRAILSASEMSFIIKSCTNLRLCNAACAAHSRTKYKYVKLQLLQLIHSRSITGPPNGPVLFFSLASVVVVCRLSSSVTLPAGGYAGLRARGRSGGRHCTAGQYGYVPLGRHLVTSSVCDDCITNLQ